ncbi:EAL domain-containing protein [Sporosarcina oncorhynchi]|uniref:EAL domain-containing protein n=1 Tax=Sporosarcina oncorhynchi TaxID=3056444 RepID=A0ABZ0L2Q4_9BACL|nr:EAL domain-containing protein [Sporosarcina sp. T2O-4]WOV86806.1 EAL domain-containing protein [Sporosarcina sp. T2O-4]
MKCDICNPTTKIYTIYFADNQRIEPLLTYFSSYPKTDWHMINDRMFWTLEPIFFDLMDYVHAHLDASAIYAVESDPHDPLRELYKMKPILEFQAEREASWIDELIQKKAIQTHFQPIVKITDGHVSIVGNELLSRGLDEHQDIISPYHLFEAARKRNRLFALDRLCRLESIQNAVPVADKLIFINFIPTAIYVPEHCLSTTFAAIKKVGIKPEQVVFEVVETDKIEDMSHLLAILDYYRSQGIKYALDDVGTGFNDLDLLSRMEPDYVKLAREYTDGVSTDPEKWQVAKTVMDMAHQVGALALAEGVEQVQDVECLMEMGYDLYQGYLFAKPSDTPLQAIDSQWKQT